MKVYSLSFLSFYVANKKSTWRRSIQVDFCCIYRETRVLAEEVIALLHHRGVLPGDDILFLSESLSALWIIFDTVLPGQSCRRRGNCSSGAWWAIISLSYPNYEV